jgi:hypothetical protein
LLIWIMSLMQFLAGLGRTFIPDGNRGTYK